jgi:FKBP-type peptidyl-prolyl cis-trans isomerase 2
VVLKTAGSQTITVTDQADNTLTSSAVVNVVAGSVSAVKLAGPIGATAGDPFSMTVTAQDGYGNTATGYIGTVAFSGGGNGATLPANYTFTSGTGDDNGSHTFSGVILKTAGNQTITVTDQADSSLTDSAVVPVVPNSAAALSLIAPSTATAGTSFAMTVKAIDAYGNTATGYVGSVSFSGGGNGATLPANYTFTSGTGDDNGRHQFSGVILKIAGNQSITVTDQADGTLTDTATVNVTPAALAGLNLAAPSSSTAGDGFSITVTAEDAYGNKVPSYTGSVAFSGGGNGASLPADYTFTSGASGTEDNGSHQFSSVVLKTAGSQTITVTDQADSSLTGSAVVSVSANVAKSLVLTAPPTVTAGSSFSVTVTAKDAYGNIANGYTGTVTFSGGGAGATLPADYTFTSGNGGTEDNGSHVFTGGVTLTATGSQTVTVMDTLDNSLTDSATVVVST